MARSNSINKRGNDTTATNFDDIQYMAGRYGAGRNRVQLSGLLCRFVYKRGTVLCQEILISFLKAPKSALSVIAILEKSPFAVVVESRVKNLFKCV